MSDYSPPAGYCPCHPGFERVKATHLFGTRLLCEPCAREFKSFVAWFVGMERTIAAGGVK